MGKALKVQSTVQEQKDVRAVELRGGPTALDLCRAEAMALPRAEVEAFTAHAPLVCYNAMRGADALRPHQAQCAALPGYSVDIFDKVTCFAKALAWAAHEAGTYAKPAAAKPLISRARALRGLILPSLVASARAGVIPAEPLKSIQKGTTGLKLARACIDCALVMKAHAQALEGKTPITKQHIDEAEHVGATLLDVLRPKTGHVVKPAAHQEKIDLRDRVWTLLSRYYDYLRRAGGFVFAGNVDEVVPSLFAAHHTRARPLVLDENGELVKSKAQLAREKRAAERKAKAEARAKADEKLKAEAKAKADAKVQAELEAAAKKKEASSASAQPTPVLQPMASMVKNLTKEAGPPSSRAGSSGVGSSPTPMNGGIGSA
jgi:hypothetical protein